MKRALITGGSGFIGSHLAEYLLKQGQAVTVVDDLSTGSISNIEHLKKNPHFRYTVDTILNRQLLAELIDSADVIYHLAASVGVKLIVSRLVDSIENNIRGTEYVLEFASKKKKKVLLTSTSEVYGRGERPDFSEDNDLMMGPTTKSRWSYACSKALDEYLGFAYYNEHGLPVVVARLFNTVGERQTDAYGMVLPSFIKQALSHQPLTIYGSGLQSRCFCYVKDVVEALYQLMEHSATAGEVYNIGSTENVTIDELADRVLAITNSISPKVYIPYHEAYREGFEDIQRRVPDIEKIKRLIGFEPSLTVDDIIRRLVKHLAVEAADAASGLTEKIALREPVHHQHL